MTESKTSTLDDRASSLSSVIDPSLSNMGSVSTRIRMARSAESTLLSPCLRANCSSRACMNSEKLRSDAETWTESIRSQYSPPGFSGIRCAACIGPGNPLSSTSMAAIRSRRRRARSVRSSSVSPSPPGWVWMRRRPFSRVADDRNPPRSGMTI